jgi:hypothetical protein
MHPPDLCWLPFSSPLTNMLALEVDQITWVPAPFPAHLKRKQNQASSSPQDGDVLVSIACNAIVSYLLLPTYVRTNTQL